MAIEWGEITKFVEAIGDSATPFLGTMAAVGVLSMALIQTVKDIFPLRKWFHRWKLKRWLDMKADVVKATCHERPHVDQAMEDIIRLATAGDSDAFYELDIEQLCGQMNAAAQAVLDYPERHPDLLKCMAAMADADDIEELLKPSSPQTANQPKSQNQVDARARVIHQVQRAIDGFQISAGYRWKWLLQGASFLVSFVITVVAVQMWHSRAIVDSTVKSEEISWAGVFFIGLAAGFLAPVARDLLASLRKLRS